MVPAENCKAAGAIVLEGFAFALRSVAESDAPLLVELRGDAERARFLHATVAEEAAQREYLRGQIARANDYYFVVTNLILRRDEGLIGLYDVDPGTRRGEWGRWVLRRDSLAAVESARLIYQLAFKVLDLGAVFCRTRAGNYRTLSFHDSCGLKRAPVAEGVDYVEHALAADAWPDVERRLRRAAQDVAAIVRRSPGQVST